MTAHNTINHPAGSSNAMPADTAQESGDFLMQEALDVLTAIWNWDYCHWEHISSLVTGPIASMLKANITDEDTEPGKKLLELSIRECSLEEDGTAKVRACYVWQEEDQPASEEHIIWVFINEDGRWKAATLTH